ncbi:MAG: S8 family serine peptidase [Salinivirgaceae bacterium]|nr:S8 family serine peptidase [Salinivirgaceae bacterium]
MKKAHEEYNVRIFTLTIGYGQFPLKDNQEFSDYARKLDEVSYELDILIFISTTNNPNLNIQTPEDYPDKFTSTNANIAPPAESMNNISVGATAYNFEETRFDGLAPTKDFPALYSRKFHYNYKDIDLFNAQTGNKYLTKPDILMPGGDYQECFRHGMFIAKDEGDCCLEVLSANLTQRTVKGMGTSYAAPLAANLAVKIVKAYPNINMQSIKALIINASKPIKTGDLFNSNKLLSRIMGYGLPKTEFLLTSDDNSATILVEDEIYPDYIKTFPLYLPEYLNHSLKNNGLLHINATLCFKFKPKQDNQLLYCPLHVTFAIGKNLPLDVFHSEIKTDKNGRTRNVNVPDGINGNSTKGIQIGGNSPGWAQDYYYKQKIVSNTQKISFCIARDKLIDENNCIKLAINAAYHKLLSPAEQIPYEDAAIAVSMVIRIEQKPLKDENLNSLYNELILINDLVALSELEIDAELEN